MTANLADRGGVGQGGEKTSWWQQIGVVGSRVDGSLPSDATLRNVAVLLKFKSIFLKSKSLAGNSCYRHLG